MMNLKERKISNHQSAALSELDLRMINFLPEGGNWTFIPEGLSKRVDQIRERSKLRGLIHTTYYGRLSWDAPSYTISTYYTRPGNGCHVHPSQLRVISDREAARLQSFPDSFVFHGTRRAIATQIGNAVPPILAAAVGLAVPGETVVDLFAGAGGLSLGLELSGKKIQLAVEQDNHACDTYRKNHKNDLWQTSLGSDSTTEELIQRIFDMGGCDIIAGGPPCQSFSTAGNRDQDARSTLVNTFANIVTSVRPRGFIMENVHGLKSFNKGKLLEEVSRQFTDRGYKIALFDLKAELYGVPQRRRRIFLVGSLDNEPIIPRALLANSKRKLWNPTVKDAICDLPSLLPGEGEFESFFVPSKAPSLYQAWCYGEITFKEYLDSYQISEKNQISLQGSLF